MKSTCKRFHMVSCHFMPLLSIVLDFLMVDIFLSRRFSFPFSCGSGYHSVRYGLTRSSLRQLFEKYTDDPVTKLKPDCASQVKVSLIFFFFFASLFLSSLLSFSRGLPSICYTFGGVRWSGGNTSLQMVYLYWQRVETLGLSVRCASTNSCLPD